MIVPELAHSGWSKGLDYATEKARLEAMIEATHNTREKAFLSTVYVAACNGTRCKEAIDAMMLWAQTGDKEHRVRVRKRKDKYERLVIIPSLVRKYHRTVRPQLTEMFDQYADLADTVESFCRRRLGYNIHALRFAWITAMADYMLPQEIARITGHKKLEHILLYTQKQHAETKHRELVA